MRGEVGEAVIQIYNLKPMYLPTMDWVSYLTSAGSYWAKEKYKNM